MAAKTSHDDELDAEISRFDTMTEAEVDAELARLGIDPQPTIEHVKALIRQRLAAWRAEKRQ